MGDECYIGVDPGKSGAIVVMYSNGEWTYMKNTEPAHDLALFLRGHNGARGGYAAIERVSSSPQMGVKSAFTFGSSFGLLLGLLTACEVPFIQVSPRRWQAALGCLSGGDKHVTFEAAQQLYPAGGEHVTRCMADALLLAEYCRRIRVGSPIGRIPS